jgi:DNA modification methylase
VCCDQSRILLENKYSYLFEETKEYDRKIVSYQGNKGKNIHGWFRYKEGFSEELVKNLINKFSIKPGDTLLEPFAGSGTTLLVAKTLGINAIGFDILPICHLIWQVKSKINQYNIKDLEKVLKLIETQKTEKVNLNFPHLQITQSAFSEETENDLMFYTQWIKTLDISPESQTLLKMILMSILEEISYTRKDGQYLRWDYRSDKIRQRNQKRLEQKKIPIKPFDKGVIFSVKEAFSKALNRAIHDIKSINTKKIFTYTSYQKLIQGNVLELLPTMENNKFSGVISSPPYCNRYDYTRTYALELTYLGIGETEIRQLRQSQLSCTVENKSKLDSLEKLYKSLGKYEIFLECKKIISNNQVFEEINKALETRLERGEVNNKGVLTMVKNYLIELTFVILEMYRTCQSEAYVILVNDLVKYSGEIIPIDTFFTEVAEQIGFCPIAIYILPQRKGNSSQQMGKFGRTALRKSITVWQKP